MAGAALDLNTRIEDKDVNQALKRLVDAGRDPTPALREIG